MTSRLRGRSSMMGTADSAVATEITGRGHRRRRGAGRGGAGADLLGLVRFDILEAVPDAAAQFHEAGAIADPAPALQRAGADVPPFGQVSLVQMSNHHRMLLQDQVNA